MKKCVRAIFVWLCYAGFSSARQDMGIITCHVTDANGFAVPGAAVSVISGDTNVGIKVAAGPRWHFRRDAAEDRHVLRSGRGQRIQECLRTAQASIDTPTAPK